MPHSQKESINVVARSIIENNGDFAVLRYKGIQPSAALVTLGGRIFSQTGGGVFGVDVILSGPSLPQPRAATTNTFGYYHFYEVPSGQTYIVTPQTGRYTFSPTSQAINLIDEFLDANFTAFE